MGDDIGSKGKGKPESMDVDDEEGAGQASEANFDENDRLFATGEYDAEDKQADLVYASFDDYMDSRRKRQREEKEEKELAESRAKRPKLQAMFADAKRGLSTISDKDWAALPASGDSRIKTKFERFTPAPDSLLEQAHRETQLRGSISAFEGSGTSTVSGFGAATPLSDVKALGTARKTVLGSQLDTVSKSVISGTQTAIEREGYLSSLDTSSQYSKTSGDTAQNRLLLQSATQANPTSAASWISLARLEEEAGRLKKACKVMEQACTHCPKNKDVWIEAARLNAAEPAKAILARAVQHLPDDVDLWITAAKLESDIDRRKRVFRKALERLPTSIDLWKEAVSLEKPDEARLLLNQAVKCVPHSAQMWLALAHLETYDQAKIVLNNARKALPREKLIWIAAAQLEEANGNVKMVRAIINKAVSSLMSRGVIPTRAEWLAEAERCELSESPKTCEAIVQETIGSGLDLADCESIWREDANHCIAKKQIHTARAILTHAATTFKTDQDLWRDLAMLEKNHGTRDQMLSVLERAVEHCPEADYLWVLAAKEEFTVGNFDAARKIIAQAYKISPHSEQIWLAASKIEQVDGKFEDAAGLLKLGRQKASSGRVWMKSAILERQLKHHDQELALLEEGTKLYPEFDKLWMMLGQYHERHNPVTPANKANGSASGNSMAPPSLLPMVAPGAVDSDKARATYTQGLKHCVGSVRLWICAIRYDERVNGSNSARALCERARLRIPSAAELWTEAVRIERRSGNLTVAKQMCSRALQQFGSCGPLWVELIEMEVKPADKASRFSDAFKQCDTDPMLIAAGAKIFVETRKIKNAREWFERAIKTNSTFGDVWASYYKFELHHGTESQRSDVMKRCIEAAPKYGEKWISVAKDPDNDGMKLEEILRRVALLV
jgi:pre-mRNA-processing factor 6